MTGPQAPPGPVGPGRVGGLPGVLGTRRELLAWGLTAAAGVVLAGHLVELASYPAAAGLRLNAAYRVGDRPVDALLLLLLAGSGLLVAAEPPTVRARLVVGVDLVLAAFAAVVGVVGLGLTLAAYGLPSIGGIVTGSVLVQLGGLTGLAVVGGILARLRSLTARVVAPRGDPVADRPVPERPVVEQPVPGQPVPERSASDRPLPGPPLPERPPPRPPVSGPPAPASVERSATGPTPTPAGGAPPVGPGRPVVPPAGCRPGRPGADGAALPDHDRRPPAYRRPPSHRPTDERIPGGDVHPGVGDGAGFVDRDTDRPPPPRS